MADLPLEHAAPAPSLGTMFFRQFLNDDTACASYLFGCNTAGELAVVDAHVDLVDDYIAAAEAQGSRIAAVLETHVQADHVSGLPKLVERTGASAYVPAGAGVEFEHNALADGQLVKLGNTVIQAVATPGHATAHHAYLITDHRRGEEPWMVLTGDVLLVGDVGRPDLHARSDHTAEKMAQALYRSLTERLLVLRDDLLVYPGHFRGSVCGRGLSGHPASTIGFERRHNPALAFASEDAFVSALLEDIPPVPDQQAEIIAANRAGRPLVDTP
jgi:hydroxyacylglutathione hydrolase